jgi:SAM-dependent methyltransferase
MPQPAVDRSPEALQDAAQAGAVVQADIENGPWPFAGRLFDGVVVTNYLWRPLLPAIVAAVAPGGVLIYETFAAGNETVGKPSRPDFLLRPGELLDACAGLRVVAYEDGFLDGPGALRATHRRRAGAGWHGTGALPALGRMPFSRSKLRT